MRSGLLQNDKVRIYFQGKVIRTGTVTTVITHFNVNWDDDIYVDVDGLESKVFAIGELQLISRKAKKISACHKHS